MISLRGVSRHFVRGAETVTALDDVSLDLSPGELTVAAGPSGSGKTTLLSILAGYETVDSGRIETEPPLPPEAPSAQRWRDVAFVPQALGLLDELTIAENIDLPARLDPHPDGPPSEELLELLEIGHLGGRFPAQVSGGEQQRAAIARALRLHPHVLLADEPTGHQDRVRVELVLDVLRQHAYAGRVVLLTSHDEAVISRADRVITLADGRIVDDSRSGAATR